MIEEKLKRARIGGFSFYGGKWYNIGTVLRLTKKGEFLWMLKMDK
jgi:hypothetical protein